MSAIRLQPDVCRIPDPEPAQTDPDWQSSATFRVAPATGPLPLNGLTTAQPGGFRGFQQIGESIPDHTLAGRALRGR
jgi:hypothetical protein